MDDDGSAEFRSIQAAIDDPDTAPGDVVSVAPGTYFENLVFRCGVSVVGAGYASTTVDGGGSGRVAAIHDCGSDTRLQGFTLTRGLVVAERGGGVAVEGGAPIITLNRITGNQAAASVAGSWGYYYYYCSINSGNGGGVSVVNSDATVSRNLITDNASEGGLGGGIDVLGGTPLITLNRITGNQAAAARGYYYNCYLPGTGGGVSVVNSGATVSQNLIANNSSLGNTGGGIVSSGGSPLISRNEISGNQAPIGAGIMLGGGALVTNNLITGNTASIFSGGIHAVGDRGRVINNTIADNVSSSLAGGLGLLSPSQTVVNNNVIYGNRAFGAGGLYVGAYTTPSIANNIFFLNSPESCSGAGAPLCSGSGNLTTDPLLVNPTGGDYRLGAGSPAIDSGLATGAPSDDFRGQRRPLDGDFDGTPGVDRGAYEYDRDDVLGLRFASEMLLAWDPIPGATSYHVYSGGLATLLSSGLCASRDGEDPDPTDLTFTETLTPPVGTGLAYVVIAMVGGAEGSPGWSSLGFERTLDLQCP